MSLQDKLKNNAGSDMYPFHMPGHKRRQHLYDGAVKLPFELDVTEIEGFDDLHHPTGVIKKIEDKAAWYFQVKRAFALVNGSTGGILAAIRAMTKPGDRVLIARNCHRSVYNAVELCRLRPVYIMPEIAEYDGEPLNIYGEIDPDKLEKQLKVSPRIRLVVITSPTYDGMCSDVRRIADICHTHGARLFVDEAHGGDYISTSTCSSLSRIFFPETSYRSGADVTVVSLHKSFPSMTQTALLLTQDESLIEPLQNNLAVFQTSSPSYVLLSSIEYCIDILSATRIPFWEHCVRLQRFYVKAEGLSHLTVLFNGKEYNHLSSRILISTTDADLTGYELARLLREEHHIETEMATPDYVLALTSIFDTEEGFDRLTKALEEIDHNCKPRTEPKPDYLIKTIPEQAFIPCEKYKYAKQTVPLESSEFSISMETFMAYPPGIPCIVPGEEITDEVLDHISVIRRLGGNVCFDSFRKQGEDTINTAAEQ